MGNVVEFKNVIIGLIYLWMKEGGLTKEGYVDVTVKNSEGLRTIDNLSYIRLQLGTLIKTSNMKSFKQQFSDRSLLKAVETLVNSLFIDLERLEDNEK